MTAQERLAGPKPRLLPVDKKPGAGSREPGAGGQERGNAWRRSAIIACRQRQPAASTDRFPATGYWLPAAVSARQP
jgi:hypothetical protein